MTAASRLKVDLSTFVPNNLDGAGFIVNSIPGG